LNCHALSNGTNLADGTIVIDGSGDRWQYNSKLNTWSCIGTFISAPVVTEANDGLISPPIFTRINAISEAMQDGLNFNFLKIYPHLAGYYYLFQSSNHTITFSPESSHDLRAEVNRPRLLALLSQLKCPGADGLTGERGDTGPAGTPGKSEIKHPATLDGSALLINAIAASTIETPISLRIFKDSSNKSSLTIWQPVNGDPFVVIYSEFELAADSFLHYDNVTSVISGRLISKAWSGHAWYYKANEIGHKGQRGKDGDGFIDVVENKLVDATVEATTAVISLRTNSLKSDIYFFADGLFPNNCVSKLAILHACATTSTISLNTVSDLSLAAVKSTIDDCKTITRFKFAEKQIDTPRLQFVEWTPIEACWTQHQTNQFKWKDFTPASIVAWRRANSDVNQDSRYPWAIIEPQFPGQRCCQEDFFFCSNVNDVAGGCPVLVVEPLKPEVIEICCPCDCPSYLDTSLDINLPYTYNTDSAADPTCQSFDCVIDGTLQHYDVNVRIPWTDSGSITATMTFSSQFNTICDEARYISSESCPSYPESAACPVSWSAACVNNLAITGGKKFSTIGSPLTFTYSGPSNVSLEFGIDVNLEGIICCLGYSILACAIGSSTRPTTTPTPTTTPEPTIGPQPTTTSTLPPFPTTTPPPSTTFWPPTTPPPPPTPPLPPHTTTPVPPTTHGPTPFICLGQCEWFMSPGGGEWLKVTNPCATDCSCSPPDASTPRQEYGGGYKAYTRCKPTQTTTQTPPTTPQPTTQTPPTTPQPTTPQPTTTQTPPTCNYLIAATLAWSSISDLDLYGKSGDAATCYYGNKGPTGGLTLDQDAYPACAGSPSPPETITGGFGANNTFRFWYNNFTTECPGDPTSAEVKVTNVGPATIYINGNEVLPGADYTETIQRCGANGDQSGYGGGTTIAVSCNTPPPPTTPTPTTPAP